MRLSMVLFTGMVIATSALGAEPPIGQEQPILRYISSSIQPWGVLGEGVAAHLLNTEPLEMRIGDKTYTSGLGTHANAETCFLLDGQFLSFSAEIGVQWQPGTPGSAIFRVFVDDKEIFTSEVMRGDTPAQPINIDVRGAMELRLVVDSAGDGIENDLANWANAKLERDPEARELQREDKVDIAPFSRFASWDPSRMDGTRVSRLEPVPEEDLFAGPDLIASAEGDYVVPTYEDGRGCVGMEWLERRRLTHIEVAFAEAFDGIEQVEAQYWRTSAHGGSPGGSRWQGSWLPLTGERTQDGNTIAFTPEWTESQDILQGTLKVRFICPPAAQPVRVSTMHAYTRSKWMTEEITVQADASVASGQASLAMYNGMLVESSGETLGQQWDMQQPLQLSVRYTPARSWEISDRTVLRFTLPDAQFGVAMDDVIKNGAVYVEHAGVLVSLAKEGLTLDQYRASIADKKTVLDQVREMPDQTVAQAMRYTYRPDADLGPTMLSLACDNRKFIVERRGSIAWDDNPKVYNHYESQYSEPYFCRVDPTFGVDTPDLMTRRYQREWLPVQILTVANDGLEYRQRTFVAPFGQGDQVGTLSWVQHRPLGVAEFKVINASPEERTASLSLKFLANQNDGTQADIRQEGDYLIVSRGETFLAALQLTDLQDLQLVTEAGDVRLTGVLKGRTQAGCVLYIPRWEGAVVADLAASPGPDLLANETQAYWERIFEAGMQVEVPDDLINNLIPASAMHCMLAARNEDGEYIAPWIGSINYGPLESEAHSVLRGMGAMGYDEFTRRGLEYFSKRINEEGFLTTGYTVMGTGWHLWTLGEYHQMIGDDEWLRGLAPKIEKACRWIMATRSTTRKLDKDGNKLPEYGLMPPGALADWEVFSYYFYMNGYYCAGLREAAEALLAIDWPGAQDILDDAMEYEADIQRAYNWIKGQAPVLPLQDGTWAQAYPTHVYVPAPIENFYPGEDFGRSWCYDIELGAHHLIPFGILDAKSNDARSMMNHKEDVQFLRKGMAYYEDVEANHADWFNLGGFAKVQPYYARTGEVYALADDVKPFIRTYFNTIMAMLNREDLSLWEHFLNGAYNKTHETGYLLHQTRLLFVQERDKELWLAPFVTSNWLDDGMRVSVRQAPTQFGQVAYSITSHVADGYIEASITPPQEGSPEQIVIRMRHPKGNTMREATVDGARSFTINPDDSTVHIVPGTEPITVRAQY